MSFSKLAIIGGSGFDYFETLDSSVHISQDTPYGPHSAPIIRGNIGNNDVDNHLLGDASQVDEIVFLPRHGVEHKIPPHLVNYRANIWALSQLGVERILACSVVGGISESMSPGIFVVPNQIIDYTYGREHTFFDGGYQGLKHLEFTEPYSQRLRKQLLTYLCKSGIPYRSEATYGCTQGPRLESAAEVKRLHRDGCDIVGMTTMPEAALAREMDIEYVGLSLIVNWAAGVAETDTLMSAIADNINRGMTRLKAFLPGLIKSL